MSEELNTSPEDFQGSIEEQGVKISFQPSKRKKVKKINILVEGLFTLHTAGLVKEKVSATFENFDTIDITLKNIQQIDLAAAQVIYLLKKTGTASEKIVSVDAELLKEDRALLFNAGLMTLLTKTKLTD